MSVNKLKKHIFVLPEDKANQDIANAFHRNQNINSTAMQVLPVAKGWSKVLKKFTEQHIPKMQRDGNRMVLLLIDFDNKEQARLANIKEKYIPNELVDRVFVLGTKSEPEKLKKDLGSFVGIGKALAQDCVDGTEETWGHELLKHNKAELDRLISSVKPFLFDLPKRA